MRRKGNDRRQKQVEVTVERRNCIERRSGEERRSVWDRRKCNIEVNIERRSFKDRRFYA